jgi:hypothetical protein
MKEDTIITLDNNLEYALLEKLTLDEKNYYYAAGVKDDEVPTGEYIFIEEVSQDGKTFIKKVKDEELMKKLVTIVSKEYVDAVESLNE